jgi:hypothetical protein
MENTSFSDESLKILNLLRRLNHMDQAQENHQRQLRLLHAGRFLLMLIYELINK